jgi:hypothetical protein
MFFIFYFHHFSLRPLLLRAFMVGDKKHNKKQDNSVELEASLAPAEAEVGAVAKADQ